MASEATIGTEPVHVLVEGTRDLACGVERAWQHVLDYTEWQNYSISERVSGTPGREGEVVLLEEVEPNDARWEQRARFPLGTRYEAASDSSLSTSPDRTANVSSTGSGDVRSTPAARRTSSA